MSFAVEAMPVRATVSVTRAEAIQRTEVECGAAVLEGTRAMGDRRLGPKEWRKRVDALTGHSTPPHAINRAYSKMREIMLTCALRCPRRDLPRRSPRGLRAGLGRHCGAQGTQGEQWRWTAVSLSGGPAFALDRLPMARGQAILHDLRSWQPEDPQARYELVTGDAAVEMDHARIEEEHVSLFDAEAELVPETVLRRRGRRHSQILRRRRGLDAASPGGGHALFRELLRHQALHIARRELRALPDRAAAPRARELRFDALPGANMVRRHAHRPGRAQLRSNTIASKKFSQRYIKEKKNA